MDANVLIDLCEADRTLIRLISQHVGPIHVPLPVLQEVDQIDEAQCADLGILLVEPSLQTAIDAATHRRAGLSFNDHLCLLLARENGWSCVTNDRRLRQECFAENVPVLWGLEVVALLVDGGVLTPNAAEEIGRAIQRANPMFITHSVIERFRERIGLGAKKKPGRKPQKGHS